MSAGKGVKHSILFGRSLGDHLEVSIDTPDIIQSIDDAQQKYNYILACIAD